jgi:hypothetical protein
VNAEIVGQEAELLKHGIKHLEDAAKVILSVSFSLSFICILVAEL